MVRWTLRSISDLEEVGSYIARDNPDAANRWIAKLRARAQAASRLPLAGRIVPEFAEHEIREVFERAYRIVYRVETGSIVVLTVQHGRRLLCGDDLGT